MRYTRPRPSTFSETMVRPSFFFSALAKAPRTVCGCQPIRYTIWWMTALFLRWSRAISGSPAWRVRGVSNPVKPAAALGGSIRPDAAVKAAFAFFAPLAACGASVGDLFAAPWMPPLDLGFVGSGSMPMATAPLLVMVCVTDLARHLWGAVRSDLPL
jgi:hypothetical protein